MTATAMKAAAMRRWARLLGAVVLIAALSGCVRLDLDMAVSRDDTLSGTIVIAFDKKVLGPFVDQADVLAQVERYNPFGRLSTARGSVAVEPYEADGMVGQRYRYKDVPLSEFSGLTLRHEGRRYVLAGVADLSARGDSRIGLGSFTDTAKATVRFTFPGRVIAANGAIDGRTVTWNPPFGKRTELSATAEDGRPLSAPSPLVARNTPWASWLVPAAVALATLIMVALVVVLLVRRRARLRTLASVDRHVADGGPAPAGEQPPRHPTLPLPVLETPDALIRDPRWAEQSPTDPWHAGQQGSDGR